MNRTNSNRQYECPDTFEVVSYRDSIKIIDCSFLCHYLWFPRHRLRSGSWQLWVVKDLCGVLCVAFTYFLILFAEWIACCVLFSGATKSTHTLLNAAVFEAGVLMAVCSHLKCMFTDPGAVPRGNATRENISKLNLHKGDVIYLCPKCICIKPDRAHHCRVCRRCVRKMDHHCPWVNNCIGENNQKYFILFTMYTCIISCHALCTSIYQLLSWSGNSWRGFDNNSSVLTIVIIVLLILEAVIFGIFTGVMFFSQIWAVCKDETYIEHLKKDTRARLSYWMAVKEVFGHPFSYRWFSPFHAPPQNLVDPVEMDEVCCSV